MFKVLSQPRSRPSLSSGTLATSLAAHALLLGAAVSVASLAPAAQEVEQVVDLWPIDRAPPPPPPADQPAPAAEQPAVPTAPTAPAPDDYVPPRPPAEIPSVLPDLRAEVRPPAALPGPQSRDIGVRSAPAGVPGGSGVAPGAGDVLAPAAVEELPRLRNRAEMDRVLTRLCPPLLRDSNVTGKTVLQVVVGSDGRVEPASIRVLSSTHAGFDAAARAAAEKLRFSPARVGGRAVRVQISLPIDWTLVDR